VAAEEKDILLDHLRQSRASMLDKLDGLSEYDRRRPMTPTGTNLLGLVKHLAGLEYSYLGDCFDRPAPEKLSWVEDDSIWEGADMWATADESGEYIIGLYQRACAHADRTVADLDLDVVGSVPWWPEERRHATLRRLLVRMVGETARHAGHADIVREMIDGSAGDRDMLSDEEWQAYVGKVQAAADRFA
jgi:Protein of unknown function (DUF664)